MTNPAGLRLGVALLALAASPVHAQTNEAFRSVDLGISLIADAGTPGVLHQYWRPELALEATATTPFYAGVMELGFQHGRHEARSSNVPGFRGRLLFAGWCSGVALSERVTATSGMRVGLYEMRFDGDTIPAFRRDESELGVALRSMLDYRIGERWHAQGAAAYQVVFTHERIEQVLLSAGMSRTFGMPPWLRDFLD